MKSFDRCFPLTSRNKPQSSLVLHASLKSVVTAYIISVVGFQSYLHSFLAKMSFYAGIFNVFKPTRKSPAIPPFFIMGAENHRNQFNFPVKNAIQNIIKISSACITFSTIFPCISSVTHASVSTVSKSCLAAAIRRALIVNTEVLHLKKINSHYRCNDKAYLPNNMLK